MIVVSQVMIKRIAPENETGYWRLVPYEDLPDNDTIVVAFGQHESRQFPINYGNRKVIYNTELRALFNNEEATKE